MTREEAIIALKEEELKLQTCGDLISRQALLDLAYDMSEIDGEHFTEPYMVVDVEDIQKLPPVKPQEKTGHWIGIDEEPHEDYECDKCGYVVSTFTANIEPHTEYKYCPNCGVRMIDPQESEMQE